MFEKEAEEYVMRDDVVTENDRVPFDNGYGYQTVDFEAEVKKGFQDGAEFGYNKANEWHFVKDGDLPKENKICLLYLGCNFNPIMGWIKDGVWYFEDDRNTEVWQIYVIAWKEIVLPKEIKENG